MKNQDRNDTIKLPGANLSEQFCGWGYIRGESLLNLEASRSTKHNISYYFSNIKYFDLNVNRDGIKEEKVGHMFSSNIST